MEIQHSQRKYTTSKNYAFLLSFLMTPIAFFGSLLLFFGTIEDGALMEGIVFYIVFIWLVYVLILFGVRKVWEFDRVSNTLLISI